MLINRPALPIKTIPAPPRLARRCRHRISLALAALVLAIAALAAPDFTDLAQRALVRFGTSGQSAVLAWQRLVQSAGALGEEDKLRQVNGFFNRQIRFDDDQTIWQRQDYWATPLETLGVGAGDCEDFSIAKYITLRMLGVPAERMRLIYVRARIGGPDSALSQAHMVLGYYSTPSAEPLVLDNLISDIRPASRRSDLFPIFSFNGQGLWVGNARDSSADPTARLSRWRDLLVRMRADGLE